jgi:hypothetical protein
LVKLGGDPVYREGVLTDNGNIILDVFNMQITNPVELESRSTPSSAWSPTACSRRVRRICCCWVPAKA